MVYDPSKCQPVCLLGDPNLKISNLSAYIQTRDPDLIAGVSEILQPTKFWLAPISKTYYRYIKNNNTNENQMFEEAFRASLRAVELPKEAPKEVVCETLIVKNGKGKELVAMVTDEAFDELFDEYSHAAILELGRVAFRKAGAAREDPFFKPGSSLQAGTTA